MPAAHYCIAGRKSCLLLGILLLSYTTLNPRWLQMPISHEN
jgi:hypothetical protein